jgi:hypothetical protein
VQWLGPPQFDQFFILFDVPIILTISWPSIRPMRKLFSFIKYCPGKRHRPVRPWLHAASRVLVRAIRDHRRLFPIDSPIEYNCRVIIARPNQSPLCRIWRRFFRIGSICLPLSGDPTVLDFSRVASRQVGLGSGCWTPAFKSRSRQVCQCRLRQLEVTLFHIRKATTQK